jgi:DNA-binding transcriptional regulator YiaG
MDSLPVDLRIWRAANRLSQEKAAQLIGVSLTTFSRWERGVTAPGDDNRELVREVLAKPASALPGWSGEVPF